MGDRLLYRTCHQCGKQMVYTHYVSWWNGNKKNSICQSCAAKNRSLRPGDREHRRQVMLGRFKGEKGTFYGRKHTDETKDKLREIGKITQKLRKETRCNYEIWTEKYGKEEADLRQKSFIEKLSKSATGEKNPMYGKPTPSGSGNGWKGWYNGWYFRSLRELSYRIKVIDANNKKWIPAERKNLTIEYLDWQNNKRTYRADFFIDDHYLVEVKPSNLHNSPSVSNKRKYAEAFCEKMGFEYILTDVELLSTEEIKIMRKNGSLVFCGNYEKMFKEKYDL